MDLANLTPSDEPQKLELIDPATGELMEDPRGAPYIMLHGIDSTIYKKRQRDIANRQIQQSERLRKFHMGSAEQTEKDQMDTAVACTAGWGFIEFDGQELPFNRENAYKLYSIPAILDQVREFILDRSNFTRRLSKDSAKEPVGSSTSRSRLKVASSQSENT